MTPIRKTSHNRGRVLCIGLFLILACLISSGIFFAQEDHAAYVRKNYTKYEHSIPMRDGVRLFTAVYVPNDEAKKYPILMFRTLRRGAYGGA